VEKLPQISSKSHKIFCGIQKRHWDHFTNKGRDYSERDHVRQNSRGTKYCLVYSVRELFEQTSQKKLS
jgi:hypothetical protein